MNSRKRLTAGILIAAACLLVLAVVLLMKGGGTEGQSVPLESAATRTQNTAPQETEASVSKTERSAPQSAGTDTGSEAEERFSVPDADIIADPDNSDAAEPAGTVPSDPDNLPEESYAPRTGPWLEIEE